MRRLLYVFALYLCVFTCKKSLSPESPTQASLDKSSQTLPKIVPETGTEPMRVAAMQAAINDTKVARHRCVEKAAAIDFQIVGTATFTFTFTQPIDRPFVSVGKLSTVSALLTNCFLSVFRAYSWLPGFSEGMAVEIPFSFSAPKAQYTVHHSDVPVEERMHFAVQPVLTPKNTGSSFYLYRVRAKTGERGGLGVGDSWRAMFVESGSCDYFDDNNKKMTPVGRGTAQVVVGSGGANGWSARCTKGSVVWLLWPEAAVMQKVAPVSLLSRDKPYRLDQAEVSLLIESKDYVGGVLQSVPPVVVSRLSGTARFSVRSHVHRKETEVLVILAGSGTLRIQDTKYPVKAGHAIVIPKGEEHSFQAGALGVEALQFYTPGGPEQRLKLLK